MKELPKLKSRSRRTRPLDPETPLYRISLEVSRSCNLRCMYCYSRAESTVPTVMSSADVTGILCQAVELGATLVSFVWGGEPFVYPGILSRDTCPVRFANQLGCYAYLYTNCTRIGGAEAGQLAGMDVSVIGKCNSLNPAVQDRLAGVPGAYDAIRRGLDHLMDVGLAEDFRLGVETVITKPNYGELPDLWRFFRRHNLVPEVEIPTLHGRAAEHAGDLVFPLPEAVEKFRELFGELARIDKEEFGYQWQPRPPFPAGTCNLIDRDRNCYITHTGSVQPCAGVEVSFGQLAVGRHRSNGTTLSEIILSEEFRKLRSIREHLTGPCRECEWIGECYGCRGAAFHHCGNFLGPDPFCWIHPS